MQGNKYDQLLIYYFLVVVAAVDAYGTEELALNHLLKKNAPPTGPVADNVASSSGAGVASSSDGGSGTIPVNDGDFDHEIERDVEMEDEITEDLQSEDVFSDYDMELTRESEAIEEYLALVLV